MNLKEDEFVEIVRGDAFLVVIAYANNLKDNTVKFNLLIEGKPQSMYMPNLPGNTLNPTMRGEVEKNYKNILTKVNANTVSGNVSFTAAATQEEQEEKITISKNEYDGLVRDRYITSCAMKKAKQYSDSNKTQLIPMPLLDTFNRECSHEMTEHFSVPMPSRSDITLQNIILLVIVFATFFVVFTKFNKN